jgi:hypothetical protein
MNIRFKDVPLRINGNLFPATAVSVSEKNRVAHDRLYSNNINYQGAGGFESSMSIQYLITGADLFYSAIRNNVPLSGNLAGLYFEAGYVTSINVVASTYRVATASANIVFFEKIKGALVPENLVLPPDLAIAYSKIGISNKLQLGDLYEMNFSMSSSVIPVYSMNQTTPIGVAFGNKERSLSLTSNSITNLVTVSGNIATSNIQLKTFAEATLETYSVSGVISNFEVSASPNGVIQTKATISQQE